jgi:hypothetical protein
MGKRSDDEILTKREAAAELKVCLRTIDTWTAGIRPKLPYIKIGGQKRFVRGDLRQAIERYKVHGRRAVAA